MSQMDMVMVARQQVKTSADRAKVWECIINFLTDQYKKDSFGSITTIAAAIQKYTIYDMSKEQVSTFLANYTHDKVRKLLKGKFMLETRKVKEKE